MLSPFEYIQAKLFFPEKEQKKIFPVKDLFFKVLAELGYFHLQGTDKLNLIQSFALAIILFRQQGALFSPFR